MFTLIYHNGQFCRPETLQTFLQTNVGNSPQIQIDGIMHSNGSAGQFDDAFSAFRSKIDPHIKLQPNVKKTRSSGETGAAQVPSHQAKYLDVRNRKAN